MLSPAPLSFPASYHPSCNSAVILPGFPGLNCKVPGCEPPATAFPQGHAPSHPLTWICFPSDPGDSEPDKNSFTKMLGKDPNSEAIGSVCPLCPVGSFPARFRVSQLAFAITTAER